MGWSLNSQGQSRYCIKPGYIKRPQSSYFDDNLFVERGITHQPEVYPFAAFLARRYQCTHIIDVGSGSGKKLVELYPEFHVVGIDYGANLYRCRTQYAFGDWIEWDLDKLGRIPIDERLLDHSVVICADVIEHLSKPEYLLENLSRWMKIAPVCIISTPERDLVRGSNDFGPPGNLHHVREWNMSEFATLLSAYELPVAFMGLTVSNDQSVNKHTIMAVIDAAASNKQKPPRGFRVVALLAAYNEADIILPSIQFLNDQGIEVYLIDNWSTDATYELAQTLLGHGLIGIERFPSQGASLSYGWKALLQRKEELAQTIEAHWFIHHDVDEFRSSPWIGVSLRDALFTADRAGFNAIDHTVVTFYPVDNDFAEGSDLSAHFHYFDFGKRPGHFRQIKTWKNFGQPISLVGSGGHEVQFNDRRIYPYKFLLKHYPIRSQMHGERKVLTERKTRWNSEERAAGWHTHYDDVSDNHVFLRASSELEYFEESQFNRVYLVERLSGVAILSKASSRAAENHSAHIDKNSSIIYDNPNKFARPAKLELNDQMAVFHGYQEFMLTKHSLGVLDVDASLRKKQELLAPYFCPRFLRKRTVLDLGANAGFFCFWALQNEADKATALDIDEDYLGMIRQARDQFGLERLEIVKENVVDWSKPADVVIALALVHWIYSCTAILGNLNTVIEKLSKLTKHMLIVEWIDPTDPTIENFHHTEWNKESTRGPYSLEAFEEALSRHFVRYDEIGQVSPTRKLYVAYRGAHEIDLSGPLPLMASQESVISRRILTRCDGIDYWSCVYNAENMICKQATLDLAVREAHFLSQLNSEYFPRVIGAETKEGYSVIMLEKIQGASLLDTIPQINRSALKFYAFVQHCLTLLGELQTKGIRHRDIRPDNILVRNHKPLLIDFGWAISNEHPYFTPLYLGGSERPPDGSFCDIYSMGKVLEKVGQHKYPIYDLVIELMTDPNGALRVTSLDTLKLLFACVAELGI